MEKKTLELSHYEKYKESIKKGVKRWIANPENRDKFNAYHKKYQQKKRDEHVLRLEEIKKLKEELEKLKLSINTKTYAKN
jgi:hypothetical protein